MTRRALIVAGAASATLPLVDCATHPGAHDFEPIVFVHGNGDTAALWTTTIWRFESNGWPRDRLFAIDMPYPLARDDDSRAQPGRTSTNEAREYLAAEVERVLARTGVAEVVLVGNSRGGLTIRNYVARGGASRVVAAVLGAVPNHGIYADPARSPNMEFNGAGSFIAGLNAPRGASDHEVPDGVRFLTVRSDRYDKYAQPEGTWIGQRGAPTHVTYEGPSLRGATNVVLAGVDHRETSFSPQAFAEAWRFLTGREPATLDIVNERTVVLDGTVSGLGLDNRRGSFATNLPLVGARVEVYAVDAATGQRLGPALQGKSIGANGRWGPFTTGPTTHLEFVISADGYATTHVYRSPFPRSSRFVSLRPERLADADRAAIGAGAQVTLSRPRGYFGVPRNRISLDGVSPPAGISTGVAGVSVARVRIADQPMRTVIGEFDGERIAGLAWPGADNQVVVLELTY